MAAPESVHVIYSGNVQGVGFRFTARSVAAKYAITGFVRNLTDGDVELLAEGDRSDLERFLEELSDDMAGYISDRHVSWGAARGVYSSFGIAF